MDLLTTTVGRKWKSVLKCSSKIVPEFQALPLSIFTQTFRKIFAKRNVHEQLYSILHTCCKCKGIPVALYEVA
jgi:hypothetical protein